MNAAPPSLFVAMVEHNFPVLLVFLSSVFRFVCFSAQIAEVCGLASLKYKEKRRTSTTQKAVGHQQAYKTL